MPDLDCTPQEYADKMTLSGSNMESVTYLDKNLEKIVVGKIEKIEKHPDADKTDHLSGEMLEMKQFRS